MTSPRRYLKCEIYVARSLWLLLFVLPSHATTVINTYPDWSGLTTRGWPMVAQSFTVPALDNTLLSYRTSMPSTNTHPFLFQIYLWSTNTGTVGNPVFSSEVGWPLNGELVLTNLNLSLSAGVRYAAVMDFEGYTGDSVRYQLNQDSYQDGIVAWKFTTGPWYYLDSKYNTMFRADFAPVPEPSILFFTALGLLFLLHRRLSEMTARSDQPDMGSDFQP